MPIPSPSTNWRSSWLMPSLTSIKRGVMPAVVQRRPEAVAATGEVSVDCCGPQARVDPDEQQSDTIVDQVVDLRCHGTLPAPLG